MDYKDYREVDNTIRAGEADWRLVAIYALDHIQQLRAKVIYLFGEKVCLDDFRKENLLLERKCEPETIHVFKERICEDYKSQISKLHHSTTRSLRQKTDNLKSWEGTAWGALRELEDLEDRVQYFISKKAESEGLVLEGLTFREVKS
jgi:hypothetical protein